MRWIKIKKAGPNLPNVQEVSREQDQIYLNVEEVSRRQNQIYLYVEEVSRKQDQTYLNVEEITIMMIIPMQATVLVILQMFVIVIFSCKYIYILVLEFFFSLFFYLNGTNTWIVFHHTPSNKTLKSARYIHCVIASCTFTLYKVGHNTFWLTWYKWSLQWLYI